MYDIDAIKAAANGRWIDIFNACGMGVAGIKNKHEGCPICNDGVKRFRIDDIRGDGTWICNHCGAGDGIKLVHLYMFDFKKAIEFVAGYVGISPEAQIDQSEIDRRKRESAERNKARINQDAAIKLASTEQAAIGTNMIMQHAEPATSHAYLTKKQISGSTAWFMPESFLIPTNEGQTDIKGRLVIPMINERRELISCQIIDSNFKMFLLGGQTIGAFHLIGSVHDGDVILVGEGYATMNTLHDATGYPCAVAFNANNLIAVSRIIQMFYPSNVKIVTADNDHHNNDKKVGNDGLNKARIASSDIGCRMVTVPNQIGVSDFNDFDVINGRDALINLLTELKVIDNLQAKCNH